MNPLSPMKPGVTQIFNALAKALKQTIAVALLYSDHPRKMSSNPLIDIYYGTKELIKTNLNWLIRNLAKCDSLKKCNQELH